MRRLSQITVAIVAAATSFAEELAIAAGAALVTIALWQDFGPRALAAPGLLILWLVLPTRARFIVPGRPVDDPQRKP